jgi:hypothetical protein
MSVYSLTAKEAFSKKATARAKGHPYSASCSLMEYIANDCETAFTGGTGVTTTADAAVYKVGSKSCKNVVNKVVFDPETDSVLCYGAPADDNTSLAAKTHVVLWFRCNTAIDDLSQWIQFGADNGANFASAGADHADFSVPAVAIAADTWCRIAVALDEGKVGITSCSTLGFKLMQIPTAVDMTFYFDDIRLVTLTSDGTSEIEFANSHCGSGYVLKMPFSCSRIISIDGRVGTTVGGVPQAITVQAGDADRRGALYRLNADEALEGEEVPFDRLIITPAADLGTTEVVDIRVLEAEVV